MVGGDVRPCFIGNIEKCSCHFISFKHNRLCPGPGLYPFFYTTNLIDRSASGCCCEGTGPGEKSQGLKMMTHDDRSTFVLSP